MELRIDHVNISVKDVEGTVKFLTTAMPNLRVRGGRRNDDGTWQWVHVGTDWEYIALAKGQRIEDRSALGHIGFMVDDIEALRTRLKEAGYVETTVSDEPPSRKRVYYSSATAWKLHDPEQGGDGEWEFVEYASDDPAERNDYTT
ncbi:MAG: hypothetical protein GKR89_23620 [Candidatus Latescibacteria bacterium]|nr:hypothetical protein [Candidatus Latescibacterota bacterium]